MGDSLNTAARLQAAAEPGGVLAGARDPPARRGLLRMGRADASSSSRASTSAVRAYPVLAARERPERERGLAGVEAPLVGREHELRVGPGGAARAGERDGRRAGRLRRPGRRQDAPARRAAPDAGGGCAGIEGRCVSYAETLPYWPLQGLLRDWLRYRAARSARTRAPRWRQRPSACSAEAARRGRSSRSPCCSACETAEAAAAEPELVQQRAARRLRRARARARGAGAARALARRPALGRSLVARADRAPARADPLLPAAGGARRPARPRASRSPALRARLARRERARGRARGAGGGRRARPARGPDRHRHAAGAARAPAARARRGQSRSSSRSSCARWSTPARSSAPSAGWRFDREAQRRGARQRGEGGALARRPPAGRDAGRAPAARRCSAAASRCRVLDRMVATPGARRRHGRSSRPPTLVREAGAWPERTFRFTHTLIREAAYRSILKRRRQDLHGRAADALEELYADRLRRGRRPARAALQRRRRRRARACATTSAPRRRRGRSTLSRRRLEHARRGARGRRAAGPRPTRELRVIELRLRRGVLIYELGPRHAARDPRPGGGGRGRRPAAGDPDLELVGTHVARAAAGVRWTSRAAPSTTSAPCGSRRRAAPPRWWRR